jgi:predicted component of type VI protein secretion system
MGTETSRRWRTLLPFALTVLLGACATTDTKVSCEGKLQPINLSIATNSAMPSKASGQLASGVSP